MLWSIGLKRFIRHGRLLVTDADGNEHEFGNAGATPCCAIRLHARSLHWKLLVNPDLYLGEAYMDGALTMKTGSLYDLLYLFGLNIQDDAVTGAERLFEGAQRLIQRIFIAIPAASARQNAAHHYDLPDALYDRFLDGDRQYSCAYFTHEDVSLEQAQLDKKKHIAAKLLLKPGMRVLDIGCGWGGMALYLAREFGAHVTGLTLSQEQHKIACRRATEAGLEHQVAFHLRDYREDKGGYDRIVSVGMFEHVGLRHYPDFFAQIKALLKPGGVALLHSIGRMDGPGVTNPWLKKYIFPGGYAPALSEVLPVIERLGLWATDIEILRLHYAFTLAEWRKRFEAQRAEIAALYDERFCRMWEFYLCAAEIDFRLLSTMVFQMQITRDIKAVPLTRDYMFDVERTLTHQLEVSHAAA